jgi:biopolymer transport protein ExbD
MQLPDEPDTPAQVNIVPMIDAIFAVLAFFILSTLFLTRSQGLPVTLPSATTGESQLQEQVVVTIDRQGNVFLDEQAISLEALVNQVRSLPSPTLVVINADTAAQHGQVVQVMDRLRTLEGVRLAIATQSP